MWKILFMSHSRRNVCDGKNYRVWSPQTTWNWRMEAVAGSPVWHDEYIDRPSVDSGIHLLRMMKFSSSWNGYFFKNMHHIPVQSCTLTFSESSLFNLPKVFKHSLFCLFWETSSALITACPLAKLAIRIVQKAGMVIFTRPRQLVFLFSTSHRDLIEPSSTATKVCLWLSKHQQKPSSFTCSLPPSHARTHRITLPACCLHWATDWPSSWFLRRGSSDSLEL